MPLIRRLRRELSGEHKPRVSSAIGMFFWFSYRVLHAPEVDGVEVLVHPEAGIEAERWIPTIHEAITQYLNEQQGSRISGVQLVIMGVRTHPVDTHARAVQNSVRSFLRNVLEPACDEECVG